MIFLLTLSIAFSFSFNTKAKSLDAYQLASNKKCQKSFPDHELKNSFQDSLKLYFLYSCFPIKTLNKIGDTHKKWIMPELVKIPIKKELSLKERLHVVTTLTPYLKQKSEKEKSLLSVIDLKRELKMPVSEEMTQLYNNYPSHNPNNKSINAAIDFKRRGMNTKALNLLLNKLKREKRRYKRISIYKEIVKTQKNIKRNSEYLRYSQELINLVYLKYKYRKTAKNRRDYLKHALINIRRIWTYSSTPLALKKLNTLIKYHCKRGFDCSEHYWIKGRILEERSQFNDALYWFSRAVSATSKKHKEYQNRLWNLSWLSYKHRGAIEAKKVTLRNIKNISENKVGSKLYFWLSKWDSENAKKYEDLIKLHHPLSFYLWGKYTLNQKLNLKSYTSKQIRKIAKKNYEKNLYTLYELQENSLARSYVKHIERQKNIFKRNLAWKKLKALTGLYADLLLDLEAKNIKPEESLFFFFSRGYEKEVSQAAKEFKIPKNMIWSIIRQESNFNTYARSWADAFGLTQVLKKRAFDFHKSVENEEKEINPFTLYNPALNTRVGAWLIKENLNYFNGELPLTIAAYNASREKVDQWREKFYKNENWLHLIEEITYRETRKYVKLVSRNLEVYKTLEKAN